MRTVPVGVILAALAGVTAAESDWPVYGGDPGGSQYSPLAQINRDNVARLQLAWQHRSGDIVEAPGLAGTSYQVTPLHANGTLYYCTPLNKVFALDPATGDQRWVFDAHRGLIAGDPIPGACRGVAYWEAVAPAADAACARRIFKGDMGGHLIALDADTGRPCQDFGAAAGHPGYVTYLDYENHGEGWWSITSPPAIFEDRVIVGAAVDDTVANAFDGIVRAFDVRTGELRWAFNPIPEPLRDTVGAANVWSTMSVDLGRGLVFLPTTSLSTDYYGGFRGAGSPYADAIVALDGATGQVRWHHQLVHHNLFDYDLPAHPLLVTIRTGGGTREVAIQQTKTGDVFVFDRDTGEPVFPIEEQPAPASEIPDERAAPTQPRSPGIAAFTRQTLTVDDMFGVTLFDRNWCRSKFQASRYDGLFTPPSEQGSIIFPSIRGGGNWGGAAFDPNSNLLIVRADALATRVRLFQPVDPANEPVSTDYADRSLPLRGTPWWVKTKPFLSPLGIPCTPPPWGTLAAIDLDDGQLKWQVPLGTVRRAGVNLPERADWGSPNVGGPIVTAGGLIFIGAGLDHRIRAFDVATGERLWVRSLPAPGMAVPMTYESGGRQFVVIAAGGSAMADTALSDAIVAFALED